MTNWKDIRGYKGIYSVSDEGDVWTEHRERCLTPAEDKNGYLSVLLSKDGHGRRHFIHVLVMQHHGPKKPGASYEVAHRDGDNQNNHVRNLRWKTKRQNAQDRRVHGTENIGEQNPRARLAARDVRSIRRAYESGEATQQELADEYGVSRPQISHIIQGKRWGHL